jgi:hypothetical protein
VWLHDINHRNMGVDGQLFEIVQLHGGGFQLGTSNAPHSNPPDPGPMTCISTLPRMRCVTAFMSTIFNHGVFWQKYTIYHKMPMLVARQEHTLAIDGVYIHVCILSSSLHLNSNIPVR